MRRILFAIAFIAACSRGSKSPQTTASPRPSAYEVEIGRQTFLRYCAGCHGDTGQGDGFNSFNLDPHPRDLSDPAFQKIKSNSDFEDAIRRGGAGVGLSSLMPPWGRTLDARHVHDVVLYVRSLRRSGTIK